MTTLDKEIELLRMRAEAAMVHAPLASGAAPEGMVDAMRLVEELRVYQTELEIQNQDLKAAQLATEAAMRKYRRMFENLPLEGLIVDDQGFIIEANALARKRFSLHQNAALQRRSAYQLFAFGSRATLYATLTQGRDVSSATKCQLLASRSGDVAEVDAHIIAIDPASLVDDERLMVLVDRTYERQLAVKHEELVESEERMQTAHNLLSNLAAQVPGAIYQFRRFQDGHSCFPFASPGIEDMYEVTPQQVAEDASAVFAVLHPDDSRAVADSIAESAEHLTPWLHEYRVVLPIQGTRWRRGVARPQRLEDGSVLWHGFITDITQEHRVQAVLKENERILRTSIEALGEAFVLYDAQDRLVFCTEKYKDLYNTSADLIVPGAQFEHIIRVGAERGQYMEAVGRVDAWVAERMEKHRAGNTAITQQIDSGRTLRILERRTEDGHTVGFRVDVTAFAQATEAALTANRHYQQLLSAASEVAIISTDTHGLVQVFNRGAERMLGYTAEEVVGRVFVTTFHLAQEIDERSTELYAELGLATAGFQVFTAKADIDGQEHREWIYVCKNGERVDVSMVVTAMRSQSGEITGYLGISHDISKRKQAQASLKLAASVFTWAREGIVITDAQTHIISANEAFSRITGYTQDEAMGQKTRILKSGRQDTAFYARMWQSLNSVGHWEGEVWNRRKSGEVYAELLSISAVYDAQNHLQNYVALFTDISVQKAHEQALEHIARYDALTGLPNRAVLADRLQQEMAHCTRRHQLLAVVFIDLDGFKLVNDLHGHDIGDELLIAVSQHMKTALREGDTLSRIGGDEFVALLTGLDHSKDCELVLSRLLQAAAEPVLASGNVLRVTASIGVTLFPQDAANADQLLRHADHAMYQAKQAGKNRYHYFDVKDDAEVKVHRDSLEEISAALDAGEFVLHYQPKVNMKTGAVIGMEALIRWQHPQQGLLLPGRFLPKVKGHPLSIKLGDWVIRTAVQQLAMWNAMDLRLSISVNIDALHLQQGSFVGSLRNTFALHPGVQAAQLDLEVLETSAMDDIDKVTAIMRACCELGVGFSLDDFGTGYSSLTYLKRLPADLMKIDQSFVIGMVQDSDDFVIVEGVVGLARAFGRNVLAEGVETVAHGELLLALGCELGQGYGIAHAMLASAVPGWVQTWQADASWSTWAEQSHTDSSRELVLADIKHRHWLRDLENYASGKREGVPPLSVHECQMGKWLDTQGKQHYSQHPAFDAMTLAHDRVHAMAIVLVEWFKAGEHARIRASLSALNVLREQLIAAIRLLGTPHHGE